MSKVTPKKSARWNSEAGMKAGSEAVGERFPVSSIGNGECNHVRYVHPDTGKSVVIDDVTGQPIHFGGKEFRNFPGSGDLIE